MIWHHGRFYLYEGWAVIGPRGNDGPRKLQRTGRYPGYIRLRELGTDKILTVRSDRVMLNAVAILGMTCHPNHEPDAQGKCAFGCDD